MKQHWRLLLAMLLLCKSAGVLAQTPPLKAQQAKPGTLTDSAENLFSKVIGLAQSGLLFPFGSISETAVRAHVEKVIAGFQLSEDTRFSPPTWGGLWSGHDTSGIVVLKIVSPFSSTRSFAEVGFAPAAEQPIQPALLAHLLAKAETTKVVGADTVDLVFAMEQTPFAATLCVSQTTLTVRLTGTLVSHGQHVV